MPTHSRRENTFVRRFLSAYENASWANAKVDWLDERIDGAVEALVTRSDGKTLAIEHTIIEPFVREKKDFAFFKSVFLGLENDNEIIVPGSWIRVSVPAGILRGQKENKETLVEAVHNWLRANTHALIEGISQHSLSVKPSSGRGTLEIVLYTKVVSLPGPGKLTIRRQQMERNLDQIVRKALKRKLPKLAGTGADRRLLFLERQHMNLLQEDILAEIDKQRSSFPDLAKVDEIWIVETVFYDHDSYLRFERFDNGHVVTSFDFHDTTLPSRVEDGASVPIGS